MRDPNLYRPTRPESGLVGGRPGGKPGEDEGLDELLRRLQPVLKHVGVTRVADVTWLDDVGIPCAQAIRPEARTLSVSQGKGETHLAAEVGASMEAIELWHAENLPHSGIRAAVNDVANYIPYRLDALRQCVPPSVGGDTVLEWTWATNMRTGEPSLVPSEVVRLDSVVANSWMVPHFSASSNGLASGASFSEALLHALCEVVERDALSDDPINRSTVDTEDLPPAPLSMVQRLRGAGHVVLVERLAARVHVPTFLVTLLCDDFNERFVGSGTHPDPTSALCRALAEAAQARVAKIAGTREDIGGSLIRASGRAQPWPSVNVDTRWSDLVGASAQSSAVTVNALVGWIAEVTGFDPMVIDLSRPEIGVPVVRVVCPGLDCPWDY